MKKLTPYFERNGIKIYCGDRLEIMPKLVEEGVVVDMILADIPYGTTALDFDKKAKRDDVNVILEKLQGIDFEPEVLNILKCTIKDIYASPLDLVKMWQCFNDIAKPNAAIAMTATQPFTNTLINSKKGLFRYSWVWRKNKAANFVSSKYVPFKICEDVLVFYRKHPTYNPQRVSRSFKGLKRYPAGKDHIKAGTGRHLSLYGGEMLDIPTVYSADGKKNPVNILTFPIDYDRKGNSHHSTQKPVALMEYLIKTYTNPANLVLDPTMGGGTTLLAALNEGRAAIGIEINEKYCKNAVSRLGKPTLFSLPTSNK